MPLSAKSEEAWYNLLDVMSEVITCATKPEAKRLLKALEGFGNESLTEFELEIISILDGVVKDVLKK